MKSALLLASWCAGALLAAPAVAAPASDEEPEALRLSEAVAREVLADAARYFAEGNEASLSDPARARELYGAAALKFEHLIEQGFTNAKLYEDLANTYFLSGDVGRAILNYRRALRFLPGDAKLGESLDRARAERVDLFAQGEAGRLKRGILFWHYHMGDRSRLLIFAVSYTLLWIFAGWRLFVPGRRFGGARRLCLAVCVAVGISMVIHAVAGTDRRSGVVVAPEVVARKGDGYIYEPALNNALHSGAEFLLVERRGQWVHARFENGERAWLPAESVEFLGLL